MSKPLRKETRRLDQWLANLGYVSRRESGLVCRSGRVTVKGTIEKDAGRKVTADLVRLDGEPLDHPDGLTLLLHKPAGLTCSHEEREGPLVYDLLPPRWRLRNPPVSSAGRLDKETRGLILLSDNGDLIHRLTSPKHHVDKIYEARVDRELDPKLIGIFAAGDLILDGENKPCLPARLEIVEPTLARVTLSEGRYHQVRRMFAASGWTVTDLLRTHFGPWDLGSLKEGEWREVEA